MQDSQTNGQHASESDRPEKIVQVNSGSDEPRTAGNGTPEITTNDGSVIETLDTTLHGKPGWSEGENPSGSNRADYYERRSQGKSDSEEEMEELRKNKSGDTNK